LAFSTPGQRFGQPPLGGLHGRDRDVLTRLGRLEIVLFLVSRSLVDHPGRGQLVVADEFLLAILPTGDVLTHLRLTLLDLGLGGGDLGLRYGHRCLGLHHARPRLLDGGGGLLNLLLDFRREDPGDYLAAFDGVADVHSLTLEKPGNLGIEPNVVVRVNDAGLGRRQHEPTATGMDDPDADRGFVPPLLVPGLLRIGLMMAKLVDNPAQRDGDQDSPRKPPDPGVAGTRRLPAALAQLPCRVPPRWPRLDRRGHDFRPSCCKPFGP